jgi:polyhydroxyalkanoate synthase
MSTTSPHAADTSLAEAFEALTNGLPTLPGLPDAIAPDKAAELAKSSVRQPAALLNRMLRIGAEQVRITAGMSDVAPERKDRRFSDEAFENNPLFRRLAQTYLLWNREVHGMVDDLDLDEMTRLRAEFFLNLVTEAAAPTNVLPGNPAAMRKAVETRGKSLVQGLRNVADDFAHNGGMPLMVDSEPFVPGENTAATPGAVVFRNPILELIQYEPTTPKVHEQPLLITPPQINKFYVLDMGPGRSLVEHAVGQGHQTFMISWRNPGPEQRHWDLDAYSNAILEATDAVMEITGADKLNMLGVCAGGMTNAAVLGHLAAIADERIGSASFLVSVLDWAIPSTMASLLTPPAVEAMRQQSDSAGLLDGAELGKIFALMRPNDLVWNYWVNNYLMGDKPAAFDVLAWNCDATNLPAALHNDFLDIAAGNQLTEPGTVEVLGTPIDLGQVSCPSFVVGAVTDHITPWQGCYQTVNLLGGESEFVLSSQGHIQALVNPSGNPKGSYHLNPATPESADEWMADATSHKGSWWDYWATWLEPHGGDLVDPPSELGSETNPVLVAAPGTYVTEPRPTAD